MKSMKSQAQETWAILSSQAVWALEVSQGLGRHYRMPQICQSTMAEATQSRVDRTTTQWLSQLYKIPLLLLQMASHPDPGPIPVVANYLTVN